MCSGGADGVLEALNGITFLLQKAAELLSAKAVLVTAAVLAVLLPCFDVPFSFLNEAICVPSKGTLLEPHGETPLHGTPLAVPSPTR